MKSLILIAVVFVATVVNAADDDCPGFDPIKECEHCLYQESYNQYTVNKCNPNIYYHCEMTRGSITAHKQYCPKCFGFSKDTWGCTIRDKDCTPDVQELFTERIRHWGDYCYRYAIGPEGEYRQNYRVVTDATLTAPFNPLLYYYWCVNGFDYLMPCPDETYFDVETCQCQICYRDGPVWPCTHSDKKVFCLSFDNDGAERGIWYNQDSSASLNSWSHAGAGRSLHLPGSPADVEVPYFQNNEFSQFKLCGWFETANPNADQGLAFNGGKPGDDCYPGSIEISLIGGQVFGEIKTDSASPFAAYSLTNPLTIAAGTWYEACLTYNGNTLELSVHEDGQKETTVSTKASGVTKRNKCNLMFGANFDGLGNQNFFNGNVDDLCFWRAV